MNTSTTSSLNIRINSELKKEFDAFCSDVGLNTSVAITLFMKRTLQERKIPFEISAPDSFYSDRNLRRLERAAADMEKNGGLSHDEELKAYEKNLAR